MGYHIIIVGGDVIVLSFAHAHLVLKDSGHGGGTFTVLYSGYLVDIFSQKIIVVLLSEVSLVIGQVIDSIGILGLQILQIVFISDARIVAINFGLTYLGPLFKSVK